MAEAEQKLANVDHAEKDPLLIILWRLNHQDKTLEGINSKLGSLDKTLTDHISREGTIQESIDEIVVMWKGSKIVARILTWLVGIAAAFGAAWAMAKKGFS